MKPLRAGLHAVSDFVVGDDWLTAVVVALALTAAVAQAGVAAWWVLPFAVLVLLTLSIRRAMRLK